MEMHQPYSSSPPSSNSSSNSPSHEFSFTISFNSCSNSSTTTTNNTTSFNNEKSKLASQRNPLSALDLSPADEIFFHGHLLPLHLLSHLSQSPRSSTNSMESFTLPIKELLEDEIPKQSTSTSTSTNTSTSANTGNNKENKNRGTKGEGKSKPNSFSLFGLKKGPKGSKEEDNNSNKHKKRVKFDVIHALKKYLRMVQPLVMFRGRRDKFRGPNGSQSYSYSGNVTPRGKKKESIRGWRGKQLLHSAPASMRTSPTNSGLLFASTADLPPPSDSTMEELQAAIQAAIAHCKNSIAKEEKLV